MHDGFILQKHREPGFTVNVMTPSVKKSRHIRIILKTSLLKIVTYLYIRNKVPRVPVAVNFLLAQNAHKIPFLAIFITDNGLVITSEEIYVQQYYLYAVTGIPYKFI